jgi:hypothetical protein
MWLASSFAPRIRVVSTGSVIDTLKNRLMNLEKVPGMFAVVWEFAERCISWVWEDED